MKANELMIGDLINCFGVIRRVTSIFGLERPEDDGLLTTMVPGFEFPESNLSFRPCYARPIPLTAEIIDTVSHHPKMALYWDDKKTEETGENWYELRICKDGDTALTMEIRYVHELQHALRLCGIEEDIIEL